MKPTCDEVVEKVARDSYEAMEVLDYTTYGTCGEVCQERWREIAKAALRALQDMMPDIEIAGGVTNYYNGEDAVNKYLYFKTMGRGDDR